MNNYNLCKSKNLRVLILYTELAAYLTSCLKHFVNQNKNAKILLVHYPINKEAPFLFNLPESIDKQEFNLINLDVIHQKIEQFEPQVILCSGWGNKHYLKWVKKYYNLAETVLCFDNQWQGKPKQWLLRLISPFWIKKLFKKVWVPGIPQQNYAIKLGFEFGQISLGFYVADTDIFKPIGTNKLMTKGDFPKTMVSVARYIPQKDLPTLWNAFIKANENTGSNWVLKCMGLGDLFDERIQNEYIHHLGFKQPEELREILKSSGVYILPSIYEPWGVAVHEAALSAMPLILSNKIGSGSMFLTSENGFSFMVSDAQELQIYLEKIMTMNDESLWKMSQKSYDLAIQLTLDDWGKCLNKLGNTCAE